MRSLMWHAESDALFETHTESERDRTFNEHGCEDVTGKRKFEELFKKEQMSKEQTIEVRVTRDMMIGDMGPKAPVINQVIAGGRAMRMLRERGVPIIGVLGVFSVERGRLTMFIEDGLDGDELVYVYVGEPLPPNMRNLQFTFTTTLQDKLREDEEL